MSRIERDISFLLTRKLADELVPGGASLPSVLSVDFFAGIFVRDGRRMPLADAISTTRSGTALMAGSDGTYRSFGTDEAPVVTGVGLDIYRQIAPQLCSGADMSNGSYWRPENLVLVETAAGPDGNANAVSATEAAVTGSHAIYGTSGNRPAYGSGQAGEKRLGEAWFGANHAPGHGYIQFASGGNGLYAILDTQTGIVTDTGTTSDETIHDYGVEQTPSGYRLWVLFSKLTGFQGGYIVPAIGSIDVAAIASGLPNGKGYPGNGSSVTVWNLNIAVADFRVPPIPTGANLTPRFATTVTDPDFASLVSAYGLRSGFQVSTRIALDRLSDSAARCVWAAGADADNHVRLDFTSSDTAKFVLRKAGADLLTLEAAAFTDTGDKTIAVTAKDGAWTLTATGVAGDSDTGTYGLPALSGFRYGSQFGDEAYLNGTMKSLVLGRTA